MSKKIIKNLICITLSVCLLVGMCVPISAAEGITVTLTGSDLYTLLSSEVWDCQFYYTRENGKAYTIGDVYKYYCVINSDGSLSISFLQSVFGMNIESEIGNGYLKNFGFSFDFNCKYENVSSISVEAGSFFNYSVDENIDYYFANGAVLKPNDTSYFIECTSPNVHSNISFFTWNSVETGAASTVSDVTLYKGSLEFSDLISFDSFNLSSGTYNEDSLNYIISGEVATYISYTFVIDSISITTPYATVIYEQLQKAVDLLEKQTEQDKEYYESVTTPTDEDESKLDDQQQAFDDVQSKADEIQGVLDDVEKPSEEEIDEILDNFIDSYDPSSFSAILGGFFGIQFYMTIVIGSTTISLLAFILFRKRG